MAYPKPKLLVSKCLSFEATRYDGSIIPSLLIEKLKPFVDFVPVCPEYEIGLGIPREPIRIIIVDGQKKLWQKKTNTDVTDKMNDFSKKFLDQLGSVDGFIAMHSSPTSGVKNVKQYLGYNDMKGNSQGVGFFAGAFMQKFPGFPCEDEMRLTAVELRENFLTKIWLLADFREIKEKKDLELLVDYQTRNKLLLTALNQSFVPKLGRIVSDRKKLGQKVFIQYEELLLKAMSYDFTKKNYSNVCLKMFGYFGKKLTIDEKKFFLNAQKQYSQGKIHLTAMKSLLWSYALRFGDSYIKKQTFFRPYPEELEDTVGEKCVLK